MLVVRPHKRIQDIDECCESDGEIDDGAVLPAQKSLRARLDGVGDFPHLRRAGVALQHIPHELEGEEQSKNADAQDQREFHVEEGTPFW